VVGWCRTGCASHGWRAGRAQTINAAGTTVDEPGIYPSLKVEPAPPGQRQRAWLCRKRL